MDCCWYLILQILNISCYFQHKISRLVTNSCFTLLTELAKLNCCKQVKGILPDFIEGTLKKSQNVDFLLLFVALYQEAQFPPPQKKN